MSPPRNPMLLDPRQLRAMGLGQVQAPAQPAPVLEPKCEQWLQPGQPGNQTSRGWCTSERVVLAGGILQTNIVHPSIIPFEQLYRRLPAEGMFSSATNPDRPFVFELGAFRVPGNMTLCLFDFRPDIYRFSGVDAGDFIPVEARRFGSVLGFDVTVDGRRTYGNLQYQLDPAPIDLATSQAFQPQPGTTDLFTQDAGLTQARGFGDAAGAGTGLQPQRPTGYGPSNVPVMMLASGSQTIQIRCVVFRPIPSPIAFIEYDIAGMLVPAQTFNALLECIKPVSDIPR